MLQGTDGKVRRNDRLLKRNRDVDGTWFSEIGSWNEYLCKQCSRVHLLRLQCVDPRNEVWTHFFQNIQDEVLNLTTPKHHGYRVFEARPMGLNTRF